ncbi:hypothetical protein [Litoreibacter janthinus]|nr:hypothetical protein [Litoreibacter janthinus]
MTTEAHRPAKRRFLSDKAKRLFSAHDKAIAAERAKLDLGE